MIDAFIVKAELKSFGLGRRTLILFQTKKYKRHDFISKPKANPEKIRGNDS